MLVFPGLMQPLEVAGKQILSWDDGGSRLVMEAGSVVRWASCPRCACGSARPHGCSQRTFSERLDTLVESGRRRTLRLAEALCLLGYALGGEAAAWLAAWLGMRISGPTVLRELRRAGYPPPAAAPVIIGIDDWALARGHRYGTIVVDLERRCPIELLPGRDVATIVPWLLATPGVEVIARNRAGAYADASRTAAPAAQQVADRWHLPANLRDAIERRLLRCMPQMRQAAQQASKTLCPDAEPAKVPAEPDVITVPLMSMKAQQLRSSQRRALRLARYEEVLRRRQTGESIMAISRTMHLDRRTMRGFVHASTFPQACSARCRSHVARHSSAIPGRTSRRRLPQRHADLA